MPADRLKNGIKELVKKLRTSLNTRDVLSFLLFLALSAGIWFLNVLDKKRETTYQIPVIYIQMPQDIRILGNLPDHFEVDLQDEGLNLLKYKKENINPIEISFNQDFETSGTIKKDNLELNQLIASNLLPTTTIMDIRPHDIKLEYRKLQSKRVPVVFMGEITTASQHFQSSPFVLKPSDIEIYGTAPQLESVDHVETVHMHLDNLNDTVLRNIELVTPGTGIQMEREQAVLKVFVSRFTEKKMTLPVLVKNCPVGILLRTFPAEVNLTFNVSMQYFSQLKKSDIQVYVDYNEISRKKNVKPKLQIINNNQYIFNIRTSPEKVDYLLETK